MPSPTTPAEPDHPRALVPVLVGVTLVVALVSSLGAPLIPSVADALDVSLDSAQWSLTAALLASAIAAPIMGRLGDGPYRREAIAGGLVVVLVGSVIAGAAQSLPVLVIGRTMQGVGLGLAPITMAAARDALPADRSPGVIGVLSVTAAAGVGAGYPVSGLIAEQFGVHAAFLFGGIMSAIALAFAVAVIPSSRASRSVPLDVPGAIVITAWLVPLLLAIGQGEAWGWTSPSIVGLVVGAAVIATVWVRMELRRPSPLVDLRQLRHPAVLTADFAAIVLGLALYMFLTVVTEFVQMPKSAGYGFGSSTVVAGLCLLPFSLTSFPTSRAVEPLRRRVGARAVLIGGALTISAAGVFFALVHDALWHALLTMGVVGVGFGLTFAAIPGLIARAVPDEDIGSALGFYQVIRSVGFSVGSALVASILVAHTPAGSRVPAEQGFVTALWIGAGICALAALVPAIVARHGPATPDVANPERDRLLRDDAELASAGLVGPKTDPPRRR